MGEIKGSFAAQKDSITRIENMVTTIHEKVNNSNISNAEFKGRVTGGGSMILSIAALITAVGAFLVIFIK